MTTFDPWAQGARLKVIVGHYGSGKTEIALNMALAARKSGRETALCDLDVVNPFFRSAEQHELLENAGVRCILPQFALTGVDVPSLPAEVRSVFGKPDLSCVLDVGGDDAGAAALGQYAPWFQKEAYDMYYVINPYRPFSETEAQIENMLRRIEFRSRLRVTGILNNANMGRLTTEKDILGGIPLVQRAADACGIPVLALCVREDIKIQTALPVYPIRRYLVPEWMEEV